MKLSFARANAAAVVALTFGVACGVAPPPVVRGAAEDDAAGAKPAKTIRQTLAKLPVKGFVLLYSHGVKWPSLVAARAAKGVSPAGFVLSHKVVADHGDVVEVQPLELGDDDHCNLGRYRTVGKFSLTAFVRKVDLAFVLARDHQVDTGKDTGYRVRAGAHVVDKGEGAYEAVVEGLSLPLPRSVLLALSYEGTGRYQAPPMRHYFRDKRRDEAESEPLRLREGARLRMGTTVIARQAILAADPKHVDLMDLGNDGLQQPFSIKPNDDGALVTLQSGCVALHAQVATKGLIRPEPAGGAIAMRGGGGTLGLGSIGGLGHGGLASRRKQPPPKEHYAPIGVSLYWNGTDHPAGALATALVSYAVTKPVCLVARQGFVGVGVTNVCLAAAEVVRDCRNVCKEHGQCSVSLDGARCVANTQVQCRQSYECKYRGACSLKAGACVVADDNDCRASYGCKQGSHTCMAYQGRCVVTPNPDCANRPACKREGRCTSDDVGACVAGVANDCATSIACKREGKCGFTKRYGDMGVCLPRRHAHCRDSDLCKQRGMCKNSGSRCVVSSSRDCRNSDACRSWGSCSLLTRKDGSISGFDFGGSPSKISYCGPASSRDCERSTRCTKHNMCVVEQNIGGGQSCGYGAVLGVGGS